jgi:hypothetical protein
MKGNYSAYLGMDRNVKQSGDPCAYVKTPRMYSWRLMTAQEADYFCKKGLIQYNTDTSIKISYNGASVAWYSPVCWNENTKTELKAYNSLWFAGSLPVTVAGNYYQIYVSATDNKIYYSTLEPTNKAVMHPWQHSRPICVRN